MVFEWMTLTLSFRDRLEKQHVRCCHLCLFPPCTLRFASNIGFSFSIWTLTSRGHGSLTPSHANEAMEFRPEENVDAHSCTCIVKTFDKLFYFRVSLQD